MIRFRRRRGNADGYILVEAVVALVLLSVGAYAVHGTIRQAVLTRGQAEDYTQARFLLEQVIAGVQIQPRIKEETKEGVFPEPHGRFRWETSIERIDLPIPARASASDFEYPRGLDYLARIRATVYWERSGQPFSESYETLVSPGKLYQPPEPAR